MQGLIEQRKISAIVFELNKLMLGDRWDPFDRLLQTIAERYNAKFYSLTDDGGLVPQNLDRLFAHDQVNIQKIYILLAQILTVSDDRLLSRLDHLSLTGKNIAIRL